MHASSIAAPHSPHASRFRAVNAAHNVHQPLLLPPSPLHLFTRCVPERVCGAPGARGAAPAEKPARASWPADACTATVQHQRAPERSAANARCAERSDRHHSDATSPHLLLLRCATRAGPLHAPATTASNGSRHQALAGAAAPPRAGHLEAAPASPPRPRCRRAPAAPPNAERVCVRASAQAHIHG